MRKRKKREREILYVGQSSDPLSRLARLGITEGKGTTSGVATGAALKQNLQRLVDAFKSQSNRSKNSAIFDRRRLNSADSAGLSSGIQRVCFIE